MDYTNIIRGIEEIEVMAKHVVLAASHVTDKISKNIANAIEPSQEDMDLESCSHEATAAAEELTAQIESLKEMILGHSITS